MTSPFKQKIMASADVQPAFGKWWFINGGMIHAHWKYKRYSSIRDTAMNLPREAWMAENARLTPLLTRLVDEVEVLKAALERIKTHEAVEMPFTTIESLRLIADNATAAHRKRWEDLK